MIAARGVAKSFGRRTVPRDVDLTLDGPGLIRVEGANGAGKSTLLRLLAGISRPTRGQVETAAPRAFVPERFRATGALRAGELLRLTQAEPVLGIDDLLARPMAALSQGQAQPVALAAALGRAPALVILDEPFTALDADAAGALESLIAHAPARRSCSWPTTRRGSRRRAGSASPTAPRRSSTPRSSRGCASAPARRRHRPSLALSATARAGW